MLAPQRLLILTASPRIVPTPIPGTPTDPSPPSDIVATAISPFQVDLVWTSNSASDTTFHVRRGLGPGPGPTDPVGDVPNNQTTFSDTAVQPNTQYFYTIWASNSAGGASVIAQSNAVTTPSESATLTPDFYNPASPVIEEQAYDLRARVLNPDQTVHTGYIVGQWAFAIIAGASFGNIGGTNNDVLTLNAGSAGNSITIQATYQGPETLSPSTQDKQLTITTQPPGGWPNNEPAGMTMIISQNGSTKTFPGWFQDSRWQDDEFVSVVSDPASRYGSAIEKRFFVGDVSGWNGQTSRTSFFNFREVYFRLIFTLSSNFQFHTGGGKYFYWGRKPTGTTTGPSQFILRPFAGRPLQLAVQISLSDGGSTSQPGSNYQPGNLPNITKNNYHTAEILHRINDPGLDNGSLRMWQDGVEGTDWSKNGQPYAPALDSEDWFATDNFIGGILAFMFWGGQGNTKTVNDYIRISEFYASGRN